MLGAARASQYAKWWNQKLTVAFSGAGAVTSIQEQSPQFNFLSTNTSYASVTNGTYDLTGLTGFTGYNNLKSVNFFHIYLPSGSWPSGLSQGAYGTPVGQNVRQGSTDYPFTMDLRIGENTGPTLDVFRFRFLANPFPGAVNVETPTVYTNWLDMWMTVIFATSNTSSTFSGWTGTSSGSLFVRGQIVNTLTGAVIAQSDNTNSITPTVGTNWPNLASLPSSIPSNLTAGADGYALSSIASSTNNFYLGGIYNSYGQTFDPKSATNTSWLTASPSASLNSVTAWNNCQYTNYDLSGGSYYLTAAGQDLFSQASDYQLLFTSDATEWTNRYRTTNNVRNT
jgi:hypothetical protein